jgi:hypothetical protein
MRDIHKIIRFLMFIEILFSITSTNICTILSGLVLILVAIFFICVLELAKEFEK